MESGEQTLPTELNLVTLNCWGLLHISDLRTPRLLEIGRQLASLTPLPHIICLQECWTKADYEAIRRETRHIVPFSKFYHSGAFGGGLAIFSKWPIEDSSMFRYPLNGRPTAFWRGDWYVGKGVACATIRFGPSPDDVIELFNTHTHSPYGSQPNNTYLCHRISQAWEMSKLLRRATQRGNLVLALGDFNMLPLSLPHRIITSHAPVRDVWRVLHPDSSLGPRHHPTEAARGRPVPTASFNLRENGASSDGAYNTWRWSKQRQKRLRAGEACPVDPEMEDPLGKRLDYIFASTGDTSRGHGWVVESASLELTERHPELHVSLSDHFAVRATLKLHHTTSHSIDPPRSLHHSAQTGSGMHSGAYLAPVTPDNGSINSSKGGKTPDDFDVQLLQSHKHQYQGYSGLEPATYDEILATIYPYLARERRQQFWRGIHFYVALFIWIGCLVAVWFVPGHSDTFVLLLFGSLIFVSGVIDGLLALLFYSAEIRVLQEFEWEVRNGKATSTGDMASLIG